LVQLRDVHLVCTPLGTQLEPQSLRNEPVGDNRHARSSEIEVATETGNIHHVAILRERPADVLVRLSRTAEASLERELAAGR